MSAKNKTKQIISALLIVSFLLPTVLFSKPQHAEAQTEAVSVPVLDALSAKLNTAIMKAVGGSLVTDTRHWILKLGEQILKMIAKRILAQITQATVNWINSGFHGSPLFLENPESFFRDISKSVVKSLVDMIGYDDFRFPFGKQTALNVIASYKSQLSTNLQYSMSNVLNNQDSIKFRTDFNYGGWNGFLINTQYPQNNYLGFEMLVGESLGSQLAGTLQAPAEKVRSLLQQGMGFLSPETCADNGGNNAYNKKIGNAFKRPTFKPTAIYVTPVNAMSQDEIDQHDASFMRNENRERDAWAVANTCQNLVSTTPGFIAATQIANALDSPRMMTLLDGALGNSFAAIFDALINKLLDMGLNALASTINPTSGDDDWMYEGQSLGDGSSSSSGGLNIQFPEHSVSVNVTDTINRTIAGGVGTYTMIPPLVDTSAVGITLKNNVIKIVGKSISGETSVIIKDSSDPARETTINIQVINPDEFITFPRAFNNTVTPDTSILVNDTVGARIYGGTEPYSIVKILREPNTDIAQVGLYGDVLFVSGVGPGQTKVTIKDSSNPVKYHIVNITVKEFGNSLFTIPTTHERIALFTSGDGRTAERNILFSNGAISSTNGDVATASYFQTATTPTIRFTAEGKTGQTTITIKGGDQQIAQFDIQVFEKLRFGSQTRYGENIRYGYSGDINRQHLLISGGRRPYNVVNNYDVSSTSILNHLGYENPAWIWQKSYLFIEFNGKLGTTSIEIMDSDGQTGTVNVTR